MELVSSNASLKDRFLCLFLPEVYYLFIVLGYDVCNVYSFQHASNTLSEFEINMFPNANSTETTPNQSSRGQIHAEDSPEIAALVPDFFWWWLGNKNELLQMIIMVL